jgi:uncharacterized protein DUF4145
MPVMDWYLVQPMPQRKWTCGYCGVNVGGYMGYYKSTPQPHQSGMAAQLPFHQIAGVAQILICPTCDKPTYFEGANQVPGTAYGRPVQHLPQDLDEIYTEARNCMAVNAFVPAVLTARTILMHIAVEQGAPENLQFGPYVDYLMKGGYVPPNATKWVDHIRLKGNAATHKIALMTRDDAEKVLRFIEMILLFLYEYPNIA